MALPGACLQPHPHSNTPTTHSQQHTDSIHAATHRQHTRSHTATATQQHTHTHARAHLCDARVVGQLVLHGHLPQQRQVVVKAQHLPRRGDHDQHLLAQRAHALSRLRVDEAHRHGHLVDWVCVRVFVWGGGGKDSVCAGRALLGHAQHERTCRLLRAWKRASALQQPAHQLAQAPHSPAACRARAALCVG
jgi:hypothetical protein